MQQNEMQQDEHVMKLQCNEKTKKWNTNTMECKSNRMLGQEMQMICYLNNIACKPSGMLMQQYSTCNKIQVFKNAYNM